MPSQWHYQHNGQPNGPVTAARLKELVDAGGLLPTDLIWKQGMAKWVPARSLKGLFPDGPVATPEAAPVPARVVRSGPPPLPPPRPQGEDRPAEAVQGFPATRRSRHLMVAGVAGVGLVTIVLVAMVAWKPSKPVGLAGRLSGEWKVQNGSRIAFRDDNSVVLQPAGGAAPVLAKLRVSDFDSKRLTLEPSNATVIGDSSDYHIEFLSDDELVASGTGDDGLPPFSRLGGTWRRANTRTQHSGSPNSPPGRRIESKDDGTGEGYIQRAESATGKKFSKPKRPAVGSRDDFVEAMKLLGANFGSRIGPEWVKWPGVGGNYLATPVGMQCERGVYTQVFGEPEPLPSVFDSIGTTTMEIERMQHRCTDGLLVLTSAKLISNDQYLIQSVQFYAPGVLPRR
ncbi:MAG: DUF4339 domain-containing protein [Bacteroidales bacterium]|nr:DUF4339 domain-containing protein [Bacteroidales bacterium]